MCNWGVHDFSPVLIQQVLRDASCSIIRTNVKKKLNDAGCGTASLGTPSWGCWCEAQGDETVVHLHSMDFTHSSALP